MKKYSIRITYNHPKILNPKTHKIDNPDVIGFVSERKCSDAFDMALKDMRSNPNMVKVERFSGKECIELVKQA